MGDSFSKKEQKNKKAKAKQEKAERKQERKNNNNKGKGLEEMLAYVDENGNLSPTPPKAGSIQEIPLEEIRIDAKPRPSEVAEPSVNSGAISYFNTSKGFGFITDDRSKERVFFHINQLTQPVKEGDKVTFSLEKTPRGYSAVDVKKK